MGTFGGNGGNGGAAVISNAVSGSTSGNLSLSQTANGAAGGWQDGTFGQSGSGGNASSTLQVQDNAAASLALTAIAKGGDRGIVINDKGVFGTGGSATALADRAGAHAVTASATATTSSLTPSAASASTKEYRRRGDRRSHLIVAGHLGVRRLTCRQPFVRHGQRICDRTGSRRSTPTRWQSDQRPRPRQTPRT